MQLSPSLLPISSVPSSMYEREPPGRLQIENNNWRRRPFESSVTWSDQRLKLSSFIRREKKDVIFTIFLGGRLSLWSITVNGKRWGVRRSGPPVGEESNLADKVEKKDWWRSSRQASSNPKLSSSETKFWARLRQVDFGLVRIGLGFGSFVRFGLGLNKVNSLHSIACSSSGTPRTPNITNSPPQK